MRQRQIPSFIELRKNSKREITEMKEYRLAILGNVSTQHLSTAIQGYGRYEAIGLRVYDADYDQIDLQLLDENSEAYQFCPDTFFLFIASEKLYEEFVSETVKENFAEKIFSRICKWWRQIELVSGKSIIQNTIMESDDKVYGSFGCKLEQSFVFQTRKLNYLIQSEALKRKNVFLADFWGMQMYLGRNFVFDSKMYHLGKLVISAEYLPIFAKIVTDIIKSIIGRNIKCIVLDLDNTLWGGIVSETGVEKIEIGALGKGHAFTDFQIWLKELKKRGILLAVCSKNDENVAKAPFLEHPEMVLKLDDFVFFIANWNDKVSNIQQIQKALNIGIDSFVFIDDNPFERELVRTMLPGVIVPELPEDPAEYVEYLKEMNLFETTAYSNEDAARTKQYQTEEKRKNLRDSVKTYDEYLKSLEMIAEMKPFDEFQVPRISQLTNRSNQFNLRTIRYSEKEIQDIIADPSRIGLYVTLKDKFGDYGLIGVLILNRKDERTLFIDTWLMSCRVLKRGVEEYIINKLVQLAKDAGVSDLMGEYVKTPKNSMVKDVYENFGFIQDKHGMWFLHVPQYQNHIHYINECSEGRNYIG